MLTDFTELATAVGRALEKKSLKLVTAESCTGGLVAQILTSIAGSSKWFDCGFVVYSNNSKKDLLGVSHEIIAQFGAVSEKTVESMATGALKKSNADVSLAISGWAGPSGGTTENPVGTVWFAWVCPDIGLKTLKQHFNGNRQQIRQQAAKLCLEKLLDLLK